jgi:hypothetical protein
VNRKFAAVLIFLAIAAAFVQFASKDIIANPAGTDKSVPTTNAAPQKPKLTHKNINDPSAWSDIYDIDEDGNVYKIGEPTAAQSDIATIGYSKAGYRVNRKTGAILAPAKKKPR